MNLKKLGKGAGGTFFVIFLSIAIVMVSLSSATQPETLKPAFVSIVSSLSTPEAVQESLIDMCGDQTSIAVTLQDKQTIIDCEKVKNGDEDYLSSIIPDVVEINEEQINEQFDQIYYAEYDCDFIDCILDSEKGNNMQVIFSQKAAQFLGEMANILIILSIVTAVILFFSTEGWGRVKAFGISFIFVGISYFVIIISQNSLSSAELSVAKPLLDVLLGSMSLYYLVFLILGIALTIAGYVVPRSYYGKKVSK